VYTNTLPGHAFRALTNNPFSFGLYSHMDMIARDLGIDPVQFYLKNVHHLNLPSIL
ncbi:MAG: molybdopterin-dependent oxidoreductase, partial [Candidatus Thorarchaeota archaeon]